MKIWTKRILLFLICMGVAGCLAVVWLSAYVKSETAARILSAEEAAKQDADCILVLGCGVRPDGTPSLMPVSYTHLDHSLSGRPSRGRENLNRAFRCEGT